MLNSLSYLLSKQGWANKCVWWFIMDKWTRDQWLGGCWNNNIMQSYILTLQTHMIILMSTLSETRFFVFILIFRKNACKEKMSECQTKAGNQECLKVWMFWTTFVFMCKPGCMVPQRVKVPWVTTLTHQGTVNRSTLARQGTVNHGDKIILKIKMNTKNLVIKNLHKLS